MNAFASVGLRSVAVILSSIGETAAAARASTIAQQVEQGIRDFGVIQHPTVGQVRPRRLLLWQGWLRSWRVVVAFVPLLCHAWSGRDWSKGPAR